ncbi:hypothetical protein JT359_18380, partial [Candidatus Poribacteria bacterium]|nr:hypothetical protein [Candidatus Poribacteria bacterium]
MHEFVENFDNLIELLENLNELREFIENQDAETQSLIGNAREVSNRSEDFKELPQLRHRLDIELPHLSEKRDKISKPLQDIKEIFAEISKHNNSLLQLADDYEILLERVEDPKNRQQVTENLHKIAKLLEDPNELPYLRDNLDKEMLNLQEILNELGEIPQLRDRLGKINVKLEDPNELLQQRSVLAQDIHKLIDKLITTCEFPRLRHKLDSLPILFKKLIPIAQELLDYMDEEKEKIREIHNDVDSIVVHRESEKIKNYKIQIWYVEVTAIEEKLFTFLPETETKLVEQSQDVKGFNPVHLMADSGARARKNPFRQISAIIGQKSKQDGDILPEPIRNSYRKGLSMLDYFNSTYGSRKGLVDTAMKTAAS